MRVIVVVVIVVFESTIVRVEYIRYRNIIYHVSFFI
jgi:hypothetical protein